MTTINCRGTHLFYVTIQAIEEIVGGQEFRHSTVSQWTKEIMDTSIRNLTALKKPYKYIGLCIFIPLIFLTSMFLASSVTCTILQKKGAGFHQASSCYWDS